MSNTITAARAAEVIDSFVDASASNQGDRSKLLSLLSLVNDYAWKKGIWPGMTAQFFVRVNPRTKELITPDGYNVLLKVNLDGCPTELRSEYFQFHQNGYGSIDECCASNWSGDVIDLGYSPVMAQPYSENACGCCLPDCGCYRIGVSTQGMPCPDKEEMELLVKGFYPHNSYEPEKRIYTTKGFTELARQNNRCACSAIDVNKVQGVDLIEGALYPLNGNMVIFDDLCWGRIDHISKPITDCPVDIWAVNPNDKFYRIARLAPTETETVYRRYRIPDACCKTPCVHGLFKKSKPTKLESLSQHMLIGDEEAIISLAIGLELLYFKKKPDESAPYLFRGIQCLEEYKSEDTGSQNTPIEYSKTTVLDYEPTSVFDGY